MTTKAISPPRPETTATIPHWADVAAMRIMADGYDCGSSCLEPTADTATRIARIIMDAHPAKSATERMEAARRVKTESITRELLWAGIGSRVWPSFLMRPLKASSQKLFTALLCIETPAGRLVYRVTDEELPLFDHLDRRENDGAPQADKSAVLHALASDGWD